MDKNFTLHCAQGVLLHKTAHTWPLPDTSTLCRHWPDDLNPGHSWVSVSRAFRLTALMLSARVRERMQVPLLGLGSTQASEIKLKRKTPPAPRSTLAPSFLSLWLHEDACPAVSTWAGLWVDGMLFPRAAHQNQGCSLRWAETGPATVVQQGRVLGPHRLLPASLPPPLTGRPAPGTMPSREEYTGWSQRGPWTQVRDKGEFL